MPDEKRSMGNEHVTFAVSNIVLALRGRKEAKADLMDKSAVKKDRF
jgi:hypothetical protein